MMSFTKLNKTMGFPRKKIKLALKAKVLDFKILKPA